MGVNDPTRSRTQTPSVFTGLRNYRCQIIFGTVGDYCREHFDGLGSTVVSARPRRVSGRETVSVKEEYVHCTVAEKCTVSRREEKEAEKSK